MMIVLNSGTHRYTRAAMESFDKSMHDMQTELQKFQGNIGEKFFGVATHNIDPHNLYISPLMCYRLKPLLEKLERNCENVQAYATVIYNSPALKDYVRGVVQSILLNDVCEINAIDYGMTEHVTVTKTTVTAYSNRCIKEP